MMGAFAEEGNVRDGLLRKALEDLLNRHAGVSPEMAIRLPARLEYNSGTRGSGSGRCDHSTRAPSRVEVKSREQTASRHCPLKKPPSLPFVARRWAQSPPGSLLVRDEAALATGTLERTETLVGAAIAMRVPALPLEREQA
jgi:hypothetical protein